MKIDAHQFALQLIAGISQLEGETGESYIKRALTLYLEAFFLIEDFDQLESGQFKNMKKHEINDLVSRLISARLI
ncbi:hypothetical protein [Sporolactobacillus sp. KGMB 08714]|uniref:hypothetical protein n=1 Tax=Sporolactobacillus sp. KGMB 08714 TaxID=3064704 RepID=UPI002FBEFACD